MSGHRVEKREVLWNVENAMVIVAIAGLALSGAFLIGLVPWSLSIVNYQAVVSVVGGLVMVKTFVQPRGRVAE